MLIQAKSVGKKFAQFDALSDFNLEVRAGDCVGLLGPNGAGKSTFIGTTYGIVHRSSGDLQVFGLDPTRQSRAIKKRLGVVTQENALDESLTVRENLELYAAFEGIPKAIARQRIDHLLKYMNAEHKKHSTIQTLSGGMKRRLVFVRALLPEPELLILDEPTTGLDPAVRHLLWGKVKELKAQGVTLLLTTHYMHEAEVLCDRIVIMNRGKIIVEGAPKTLIQEHAPGTVALFSSAENILKLKAIALEKQSNELFDIQSDGSGTTIRMPNMSSMTSFCSEHHLEPEQMRPANLEDVFLKLTGKGLSEDA